MKRITTILFLAAIFVQPAVQVFADGNVQAQEGPSKKLNQKDECLLILKNCEMQAESLQETIQRLNKEIAKGRKVYSADELKKLHYMLKDANRTLDLLLNSKEETLGM